MPEIMTPSFKKSIFCVARSGFTLVEVLVVVVLLSILTSVVIPRFLSLERAAKIASLTALAGSLSTMVEHVRAAARLSGLVPVSQNPGGSTQFEFLIETNIGSFEVDWRNLCPESRAELGDKLTTLDYLSFNNVPTSSYEARVTNQSTWVGFSLPPGQCYVVYDSFACTIEAVTSGC